MTYIWPLANMLARITQEYGANPNSVQPGGHTGMDASGKLDEPIYAEADGVIVFADWADTLGWPNPYYIATSAIIPKGAGIVVGLDVGPYLFIHGHLNRTTLNKGDRVKQGQVIGYVGYTGYTIPAGAGGTHLHLDVLPNGWNVNSPDGRYGRINPRSVIDGVGAIKPAGQVADTPAANQRDTGPLGVIRRSAPDKNSQAIEKIGPNLRLNFRGYVRKTDPYGDGNNVWFVGAFDPPTYFHSSGFTNKAVTGLADITAKLFPAPAKPPVVVKPPVVPAPLPNPALPPEVYDFALDFATVNGIAVTKQPAHITNVDVGNFPANPDTIVYHWWNSLAAAPTFIGTVAEFKRKESYKSAHWVVDDVQIAQMVSLKDRAYHAGAGGNGWIGIEVSPYATEKDAAGNYTPKALRIQANVRALTKLIQDKQQRQLRGTLHKLVPGAATSCSDLDLTTLMVPYAAPVVVPKIPGLDDTIRDLVAFYQGK